MKTDSNLEILVKAINSTENLFGDQFNKHPDALKAYALLFGEDKLKETLDSKNDLEYNAFYSVTWCFEKEIEKRNLETDLVKHYIDLIIHQPRKDYMLLMLIKLAMQRGEIENGLNYINELDEQEFETKYHGYRIVLDYYAETGELKEFKKYLKLAKPAKAPRHDVNSSKFKFISKYSEFNGIEKGIDLLNDKIFGWKFCYATIENQAHRFSLNEIDKILDKYPQFMEHDEYIKTWLFVRHYSNQRPVEISDKDFNNILKLIMTVDKSIKRGDGRLRDYMLYDFGSSVTDLKQINECKKNIVAPFYKRELNYHIKNLKGKTMGNNV